jgi:predicted MFS family arabinose efflux permease
MTASAFAIQAGDMCKTLHCPRFGAEAGIALYAWGAGVMPLFVAPVSEEFGRRPVYLVALAFLWIFHVLQAV